MSISKLDLSLSPATVIETEEEFNTPLDISDIMTICKEYSKLGSTIQFQVENMLEFGVKESIKNGSVKKESIPLIKNFLKTIKDNFYFGDASSQAKDCIELINQYQLSVKKIEIFSPLN